MRLRSISLTVAFAVAALATREGYADTGRGTGAQGARWPGESVDMVIDGSMSDLSEESYEAVVQALGAWQVAGAGLPVVTVGQGTAGDLGYSRTGDNTNAVMFAPDGAERANGALAITVITFDLDRGVILDADILLNGDYNFDCYDDDDGLNEPRAAYDLQNVLTHELGHFFGLGEDYEHEQATMYAYSLPGETSKRDLEQADAITVATLYARPGRSAPLEEQDPGVGCGGATVANSSTDGAWLWLGAALLALLVAMRRRASQHAAVFTCLLGGLVAAYSEAPVGPALFEVAQLSSRWEGGLIVTAAELHRPGCSDCRPASVEVLGGALDGIGQQVGALRPLQVGDRVYVGAPGLLPQSPE